MGISADSHVGGERAALGDDHLLRLLPGAVQQVLRRRPVEHLVQRVPVALPALAVCQCGRPGPDGPDAGPNGAPGRHRGPPKLHLGVLRRDGRRLEVEEGLEAVELRLDGAEEGHVAVAVKRNETD